MLHSKYLVRDPNEIQLQGTPWEVNYADKVKKNDKRKEDDNERWGIQVYRAKDNMPFLACPIPSVPLMKGRSLYTNTSPPRSHNDGGSDTDGSALNKKGKYTGSQETEFDEDGNPVLYLPSGDPKLDENGNRIFRDSNGLEVIGGTTRDSNGTPVPPYGNGFIWKYGLKDGEKVFVADILMQDQAMHQPVDLASTILPHTAATLAVVLNHPNVVNLIDIVDINQGTGITSAGLAFHSLTIWEDMNAGSLADLLPNRIWPNHDTKRWEDLTAPNPHRFSLPESLCWHVLESISRALLWLHHGIRDVENIETHVLPLDDDWQTILHRDLNPDNIFFMKPKGKETYGECKLGNFEQAVVASNSYIPISSRPDWSNKVSRIRKRKEFFIPMDNAIGKSLTWTRKSEVWSLGAVIFCMMTGIPPPRHWSYHWNISRMNDRGYSQGIREIISDMLKEKESERPDILTLFPRIHVEMCRWRAFTLDGNRYWDVRDDDIEKTLLEEGIVL
ncbi:hypothetical protein BP6252_06435 [Coleophoma cylindrospora]|uniref:Protein kinase domain-containing protein n=1 Tax=Coleophoma cylindrospora TaxID=1849047 RepID=A0A3D8RMM5_9HELO|nr:hypothetical protein BP6252_06435 [Coleophoma cylindrospora]